MHGESGHRSAFGQYHNADGRSQPCPSGRGDGTNVPPLESAGSPDPSPAREHPATGEPSSALEAEIPEVLLEGLQRFLESHPEWNQHRVATSAVATFLFQNGFKDACVQQHYLTALFLR